MKTSTHTHTHTHAPPSQTSFQTSNHYYGMGVCFISRCRPPLLITAHSNRAHTHTCTRFARTIKRPTCGRDRASMIVHACAPKRSKHLKIRSKTVIADAYGHTVRID